jgi:signal transduction histidine kinase
MAIAVSSCIGPARALAAEPGMEALDDAVRPIAEVIATTGPDVDDGTHVSVTGAVTFRNFRDGLRTVTIEDGTGGVWVEIVATLSSEELDRVVVGTRVMVEGELDRGGYAPRIMADQVRVIGEAPLPEPLYADISRLFVGADNGRRVHVSGVVQGYRSDDDCWSLVVDVAGRRMVARVPKEFLDTAPVSLVDAEVAFVGVIGAIRNTRGQFLSPILNVARREDLRVVATAPSSAFESPIVPLSELALFSPTPSRGRRIRSEGVVTLAYPGRFFYLQEGLHGVRVETTSLDPIVPGDLVKVAGFLDMSRHIGGLVEAVYRRRDHDARPLAVTIQPQQIIAVNERSRQIGQIARPGNYHGCLISFTATLMEARPPVGEWCGLTLADGSFIVMATLPAAEFPRIRSLRPGSTLAITGIADLNIMPDPTLSLGLDPLTQRVGVFIQRADDVAVISAPSWWTPARLGTALALALGTVTAVLGWNYLLHRRVMRQAASLAEQMRSRYESEAEFQATLRERGRLAANLHDTVLQTVTGISYQLKGMKATMKRASPEPVEAVADIDIAQRMVDHAVQQLRGTVWAMQSLPLAGQSLPMALEALVQRLQSEHGTEIVLRTTGPVQQVPDVVAGNLFLVAQEAIYNALRHADARRVDVDLSFAEPGMATVRVCDGGRGFVPGKQPAAADGHFGIEGMRDRVSRIGGRWAVESQVGAGTTITATVPIAGRLMTHDVLLHQET